jgi:hypothetical protein
MGAVCDGGERLVMDQSLSLAMFMAMARAKEAMCLLSSVQIAG